MESHSEHVLFEQKVSKEVQSDREIYFAIFIVIISILFLIYASSLSSRLPASLSRCIIWAAILVSTLSVMVVVLRLIGTPKEIYLRVYRDGLYCYNFLIIGRHIFLNVNDVTSIQKVQIHPDRTRELARDMGRFGRLAKAAAVIDEASPASHDIVAYLVLSKKPRLPLLLQLFSKRNAHMYTLSVEKENEQAFLNAIGESKMSHILIEKPIETWDEYWGKA